MPYAPIDPSRAMVLFADLQAGIVELARTMEAPRLRQGVSALARLAQAYGLPAVVTTAPGAAGAPQPIAEITSVLGALPLNTRRMTDAMLDPTSRAAILAAGRSTLLIAGVATEIVVQHTALSARANGLEVQLVVDACGGLATRTEEAALRRMIEAGVAPVSLASLAGQLAGDFTLPSGQAALGILYEIATA